MFLRSGCLIRQSHRIWGLDNVDVESLKTPPAGFLCAKQRSGDAAEDHGLPKQAQEMSSA
jgi:hypothetical protein